MKKINIFCSRKKIRFNSVALIFLVMFSFYGCSPNEKQRKLKIAQQIGHTTCDDISNITTSIAGGVIGALFNQITDGNIADINTGNLGKLPESWCNCYTYFVVQELTEKFTYKELLDIKKDKSKQLMVLQKIVQLHQADLKDCIADSTNQIFKNYNDFSKKLDDKFDK